MHAQAKIWLPETKSKIKSQKCCPSNKIARGVLYQELHLIVAVTGRGFLP